MRTLLDILMLDGVTENLISFLSFASLLNLARLNSGYRMILHDFPPALVQSDDGKGCAIRRSLNIGFHETKNWRRLKSMCSYNCSWPGHTNGYNIKGCRVCSMPVCEACIVKHSFKRGGQTFRSRHRNLCQACWSSGNRHAERLCYGSGSTSEADYASMELCQCTPKDGILCQECKEEQNYKLRERLNHCAGHGCGEQLDVGAYYHESLPRICLWCALVIRHTPPIKAVYRDLKAVHDHLSREDSGVVRTYGQEVRTPGPGMTPLDHQRASLPKNKWSIVGHQRSPLTNLSSSTKKDPKAKAVYSSTSASSKLSGSLLEHGSLETLQSLFKLPSKCDVHRFRYYATDHQRASPHRSSAVPAIRPRSDNAASFRPLEISDSLSFSESFKTLLGTECQLKDAIAEAEACDLGQNMESISKAETLNDIDISEQSMMSQETLVLN